MTYKASGTVTSAPAPIKARPAARRTPRLTRLFNSRLRPGMGATRAKIVNPILGISLFFIRRSSAIDLSQNDIQRADDRDHVRNHLALCDMRQRREIHETWSAEMNARRL